MDLKARIGKRIRTARERLGLTQREVCQRAPPLTVSRLSNYECGLREPDVETARLLAAALQTTPAFLLDISGEELTEDEKSVLRYFRDADERGKSMILRIAESEGKPYDVQPSKRE